MKIAISAASGQLGHAIVKAAIAKLGKNNVIGLARTPAKAQDLGIEIRPGNYSQVQDMEVSLQDIEVLVLVSGMDAPDKRVEMHRNVIKAAKSAGVRKIIYTSIIGIEGKCSFDAIIKSNRQTEQDIQTSGLEWIIGRNGLYVDADFEALADYKQAGKIANCADGGKCGYTSRTELAKAYVNLMVDDTLNGKIYNLCGPAVTQQELVKTINEVFGEKLSYESMSVEAYEQDRIKAHGEFFGSIIAGIYQGIREGAFDVPSDYKQAAGIEQLSLKEMGLQFK